MKFRIAEIAQDFISTLPMRERLQLAARISEEKGTIARKLNPVEKKVSAGPQAPIAVPDHSRKVGIEIEVAEHKCDRAWDRIPRHPNNTGLLGDVTNSPDGSIRGYRPLEYVSPPLEEGKVEKWVKSLLRRLETAEAEVNETCGLHVHIDASDMNARQFANLLRICYWAANLLYGISGNRQDNKYCRCNEFAEIQEAEHAIIQFGLRDFCPELSMDRYRGFNALSYPNIGTFEFRLHEPTLNPEEIIGWSRLCRDLGSYAAGTQEVWDPKDETPEEFILRISSPKNRQWIEDKILALSESYPANPLQVCLSQTNDEKEDAWDVMERDDIITTSEIARRRALSLEQTANELLQIRRNRRSTRSIRGVCQGPLQYTRHLTQERLAFNQLENLAMNIERDPTAWFSEYFQR